MKQQIFSKFYIRNKTACLERLENSSDINRELISIICDLQAIATQEHVECEKVLTPVWKELFNIVSDSPLSGSQDEAIICKSSNLLAKIQIPKIEINYNKKKHKKQSIELIMKWLQTICSLLDVIWNMQSDMIVQKKQAESDVRVLDGRIDELKNEIEDGKKLEKSQHFLLDHIQWLLGYPQNIDFYLADTKRLSTMLSDIKLLGRVLQGNGLQVYYSADSGHRDFIEIPDQSVTEPITARPLLMRDKVTVVKGQIYIPRKNIENHTEESDEPMNTLESSSDDCKNRSHIGIDITEDI